MADKRIQNGVCKYCGQVYAIDSELDLDEKECDREATLRCSCEEAMKARRLEDSRIKAHRNIKELFEEEGHIGAAKILAAAADLIAQEEIAGISVSTGSTVTGRIAITGKGAIRVSKSEKKNWSIES